MTDPIKLKPMSEELPENPWLEGDNLHFIDVSGTHHCIPDYTTKWYVSKMHYDFDEPCNDTITMVGNNKKWKSSKDNNQYNNIPDIDIPEVKLSDILDEYSGKKV